MIPNHNPMFVGRDPPPGPGLHRRHRAAPNSRNLTGPTRELVGGWATPLKNICQSIGMMTFPILMGKYN